MKRIQHCKVCNSKSFRIAYTCKDHTKSKEFFNLEICNNCSFIFTNPRPNDKDLAKYYISENYISHTNKKETFFDKMYHLVRKYAIKQKVKLINQFSNKRYHLDIGCGTGEFLFSCVNNGYKVKGVEPSSIARNQAIKNYNLDVIESVDLKKLTENNFDTISMWHVLEHVPNLNETIKNLSNILSDEGTIFVAVPNHYSWDANYYKEYWAAWDVPIHLWHFSKNTITEIFKNHGFYLVKTKPMIFDAFYVSILSEKYKYRKKNFLKGFFIGLISNIVAILINKQYSSIIYVFKKKD